MYNKFKIFCHGLLTQKQWSIISVVLFFVSMALLIIFMSGRGMFCKLYPSSGGYLSCVDYSHEESLLNSAVIIIFVLSFISSIFAFYGDSGRRRIFWKVLRFLIPGMGAVIYLGYNIGFCLMMSCNNFGEFGILLSLYAFTVFIFSLGWPIVFKDRIINERITKSIGITIFIVSLLYIGTYSLSQKLQKHEDDIQNYYSQTDKKSAVEQCKKAYFTSTRENCLLNQAEKYKDESICCGISSIEVINYCINNVKGISYGSVDKSWMTKDTGCNKQKNYYMKIIL
jgi:hypothetical protein